jgi:hypothetical protein
MSIAGACPLLDPREMEERLGKIVTRRPLAALDLLPGPRVVRKVVAEAELPRAERVENPTGSSLDRLWDHESALLITRTV